MLKKRLRPVYLLFLLIPLAYYILWNCLTPLPSPVPGHSDYLSFSAKATGPASVSLYIGEDSLYTWNLASAGYKNLEYAGAVHDSSGIILKVSGLSANDTISFAGINVYKDGKEYSLHDNRSGNFSVLNAVLLESNGIINVVASQKDVPLSIKINSSSDWRTVGDGRSYKMILLALLIAFLFLFIMAPSPKYTVISIVISLFAMLIFFISGIHSEGRLRISNALPMRGPEVYFSHDPFFSGIKKYSLPDSSKDYDISLDIEKNRFLRIDVDEKTKELKDLKVKIKWGLFSSSYWLTSVPRQDLILNDLDRRGDTFVSTGNDPYVSYTSSSFLDDLERLHFLQKNIFLFYALIVFMILVFIHSIMDFIEKMKFRWAYLIFLIVPLTFYLIDKPWNKEKYPDNPDYFYYSARTSTPSVISLFNGSDSITSWSLNSPAYQYFQCRWPFNDSDGLCLKFSGLSANDTLSLLSTVLYDDNQIYSLSDKDGTYRNIMNAVVQDHPDGQNMIVQRSGEPVIINMIPPSVTTKDVPRRWMNILIIGIILIVVTIVILLRPQPKYLMVACIITSLMMLIYHWLCSDTVDNISVRTTSRMKGAEFYYNNQPAFWASRKISVIKDSSFYNSQIGLEQYNFLRCDFADTTGVISDLHIKARTGILCKDWNYSTISPDGILMNDMLLHDGKYIICGSDPYIVLTSESQVQSIRWLLLWRKNVYFFLAVMLFLVLLFIERYLKKKDHFSFFIAAVFLLFITCELIINFFNSERQVLTLEKRLPAECPGLTYDSLNVFPAKYVKYISDQITGKRNMVTLNNLVLYSLFRDLANDQKVYIGKGSWMFYIGEHAREAYENRCPLTDAELKQMGDVLVARNYWLKQRGIHFYLVFPPLSSTVYDEIVGSRLFRYNKKTKLDQLLEYLKKNTDLDVIDVYSPIMEAKEKYNYELYYRTDMHWNFFGAYFAYKIIIDHIRKDFPDLKEPVPFKDIVWLQMDHHIGSLMSLVALEDYLTTHEYMPFSKDFTSSADTLHPFYPEYYSPEDAICVVNKNIKGPSMLMYRDSFAHWLIKYLTNNFPRSTYLWSPLFYSSIIEKEKPDIVIQEMAEHFIYDILTTNPPLTDEQDTLTTKK